MSIFCGFHAITLMLTEKYFKQKKKSFASTKKKNRKYAKQQCAYALHTENVARGQLPILSL